jgi:hypothetical protein
MRLKSKLLAPAAILTSLLAVTAEAAPQPSLDTYVMGGLRKETTAKFTGGASLNDGASFISANVPADVPVDIHGTLTVDPRDVGKGGDLFMVVETADKLFMLTTTGFQEWSFNRTDSTGLKPFASKTLAATETFSLADLESKLGISLDGRLVLVYFGYMSDTSKLNYSTPYRFRVATLPASDTVCPAGISGASTPGFPGTNKRLCILRGTYTQDIRLTNNFEYVVSGPVLFGGDNTNSVTLTIDPGVRTYGQSGADFIRISRGSKIQVNGTPEMPVIMTGAAEDTADASTTGLWGGLVVNGNALLNGCTAGTVLCEAEAEGNAGTYGGNNPTESSGTITYLVIKYAGYEISPGNELNSLTLNAVGSGTLIDYVQLHNGSDDGFETFGGSVNAKHLVLTGNDDDSLDWQKGWTGKVQHVLVIQKPVGDRGIEADNNSAARDSLPRSNPQVANLTLLGKSSNNVGIKLRDGTAGRIYNAVVKGYGSACVDIDHGPTFLVGGSSATNLTGDLTITNSLFDCTNIANDAAADNWSTVAWFNGQTGNVSTASGMTSYINTATVNARTAATLPNDGFFDQVSHIGAIKDANSDWTLGWTFRQPFTTLLP